MAPPVTIHFHDVSNYQGDYHPTGPTIAKATEGTTYTDMRFATNRSRTLAGGWPFLGYHFLRRGDIAGQVAHAAAVVGKGQPLMLDVETAGDGTYPTWAEVQTFIAGWPGRVSLAYIPRWFWSGKWGSPGLTALTSRGVGLISSMYIAYSDTGAGWGPYGGVTPVIWQYTSTPLDTNAYKGTQDQLAAVFAGGDDDMTPVQAQQLTDVVAVVDAMVNMRPNFAPAVFGGQPVILSNFLTDLEAKVDAIKAAVDALEVTAAADHTHTVTVAGAGGTGPAQPLDPTP